MSLKSICIRDNKENELEISLSDMNDGIDINIGGISVYLDMDDIEELESFLRRAQ